MFVKVNESGHRVNLKQVLYVSIDSAENGVRVVFHGSFFKIFANEPDGIIDKNTMRMMDVQIKSDIFAKREEAEAWLDNLLKSKK